MHNRASRSLRRSRCKSPVERLALGRHLGQQLAGSKALAVFLLEFMLQVDESFRAHHVDVGERAARIRRKAESEYGSDIGLAHIRDDAHRAAAGCFWRL